MIASSIERERSLSATMTIFLTYHTISSAVNIVSGVLYVLGPEAGLGIGFKTAGSNMWYGLLFEFFRNLYVILPPTVVLFVTLDRLLVLVLNMHYNERRRRIVVYADLICLAIMGLVVALYQYWLYLDKLLLSMRFIEWHLNCPRRCSESRDPVDAEEMGTETETSTLVIFVDFIVLDFVIDVDQMTLSYEESYHAIEKQG
ncbi:hypothetical protein Ddc_18111 [Ditylenchus destructor]|nr:hypothetical protein Ddc_18111 [Ditylenchus destructor]